MAIDDIVLEIGDSTFVEMYITPYNGTPIDITYGNFIEDIARYDIDAATIASGTYIVNNRGISTGGRL